MKRILTPRSTPLLAALALGLAGALLACPSARADTPQVAAAHRAVGGRSRSVTVASVIAKLADGGLTAARRARLQSLGVRVTRSLDFIGSVAVTVPRGHLAQVAALPFVTHFSEDSVVKKCDDFTDGNSGANAAFTGYALDGDGVTVAVVDTGINIRREDVQRQVVDAVSFVPGDASIDDICGHGTHVAGIIAGNGMSSTGPAYFRTFYGAARSANLVNVRVLDKNGQGSVSTVIAGIQWVIQHKNADGIRVLNLSLGHPVGESCTTDPLCQAVEAAWKAGIVVVCAAGNSGRASATQTAGAANEGWDTAYGSIQSPGNDPYVLTVGATKRNLNADGTPDLNRAHDRIATYSSRGPSRLDLILKPDLIAPGNKIISVAASNCVLFHDGQGINQIPQSYYTYARAVQGTDISTRYFCLSGTSMATPVAAAAAALLLQANPNLSPDTIKARLMVSADKWVAPGGQADACTYGAGYLNIPAALKNTLVATRPALSPAMTSTNSGLVCLDTSKIISGSHIIWGSAGLTDLHSIWGSSALTGGSLSSTLPGTTTSHIIWGSSVWTDHIIWGSSTSAVDLTSVVIGGE